MEHSQKSLCLGPALLLTGLAPLTSFVHLENGVNENLYMARLLGKLNMVSVAEIIFDPLYLVSCTSPKMEAS